VGAVGIFGLFVLSHQKRKKEKKLFILNFSSRPLSQ